MTLRYGTDVEAVEKSSGGGGYDSLDKLKLSVGSEDHVNPDDTSR